MPTGAAPGPTGPTEATTWRPVPRLLGAHALAAVAMSLPWPLLLLLVWQRTGGTARGDLLLGLAAAARMLPYVLLSGRPAGWPTATRGTCSCG